MKDSRLLGLDGVRGILALSVAYSHAFGHILGWDNTYSPIGYGDFAVDVFFIMSGVVLFHVYRHKFYSVSSPTLFFLKSRFFRLWPLHFFSLTLVFFIFLLTQGVLLPGWVHLDGLHGLGLDISLLSSIGIFGNHGVVNQPSWSISVEMWFGSFVMLIIYRDWRVSFLLVIFASIFFVYGDINPSGKAEPAKFYLSSGAWRCVFGMSLGVIGYMFASTFFGFIPVRLINMLSNFSLFVIFSIVIGFKPNGNEYVIIMIIVALSFSAIPLSNGWCINFLESAPLRNLGRISFSLYLMHTPVIYFFLIFKSDIYSLNLLLSHFVIFVSVVVSIYCNIYIENRFAFFRLRTH